MSTDHHTEKLEKGSKKSVITLGIVSDTHGWLDPELTEIFKKANVDHILHAGDIGRIEVLDALEKIAPVTAVKGNIDGDDLRFLPLETHVQYGDYAIWLRHIAGNPKRPNKAARDLINAKNPHVFIVGHSHIPVIGRVEETLWINPGAAGRQGFHAERLAILMRLDRNSGKIELDRIHLGMRTYIS